MAVRQLASHRVPSSLPSTATHRRPSPSPFCLLTSLHIASPLSPAPSPPLFSASLRRASPALAFHRCLALHCLRAPSTAFPRIALLSIRPRMPLYTLYFILTLSVHATDLHHACPGRFHPPTIPKDTRRSCRVRCGALPFSLAIQPCHSALPYCITVHPCHTARPYRVDQAGRCFTARA